MQIVAYTPEWEEGWNELVRNSKNGTFLFNRNFMDYHKDRFTDCSLIFAEGDNILGVLPANWNEYERCVYSHGGLTYGGLILSLNVTAVQVMQMIDEACEWYKDNYGAKTLIYKPVPYIYHTYPSQEDLYAIFRKNAILKSRGLSSVIMLKHPIAMRTLRKRGVKKALSYSLYLSKSNNVEPFWNILDNVLVEHHNTHPVHTISELELLMERFPKEIQMFVVKDGEDVVAGCLLFMTQQVIHVQYIAANETGREKGALDLLFHYLINEKFQDTPYLDFGISTEDNGQLLNEGLEFQKEGFGGRAVCYDIYEIPL